VRRACCSSQRLTGGHGSWSADNIETCIEQRRLNYFEQAAAGVEGLQFVVMSDRRTRQLERQQDRDLQRTEAPRLLRDKQLAMAVWVSIRAGKGPARTERVAQRERQIVNFCVFHFYHDLILREFLSQQSIRGEFSICCAGWRVQRVPG